MRSSLLCFERFKRPEPRRHPDEELAEPRSSNCVLVNVSNAIEGCQQGRGESLVKHVDSLVGKLWYAMEIRKDSDLA